MTVVLDGPATVDDLRMLLAELDREGAARRAEAVAAAQRVRDSIDPPLFGPTLSDPAANTVGKSHGRTTEDAAKWAAYPKSGGHRERVLDALAQSFHGYTDQELEHLLNLPRPSAGNRRGELVAGGWVRDSGRTRRTEAGNEATVWVMTHEGRMAWRQKRAVRL